jgi:hypothetical protein
MFLDLLKYYKKVRVSWFNWIHMPGLVAWTVFALKSGKPRSKGVGIYVTGVYDYVVTPSDTSMKNSDF